MNSNKQRAQSELLYFSSLVSGNAKEFVERNGPNGVDHNIDPEKTKISPSVRELNAKALQKLVGIPHGTKTATVVHLGVDTEQISRVC